jgi:VWFA-related protein
MRWLAVVLLCGAATFATATAHQSEPQGPAVFRSLATAVSLDVSVRRGKLPVVGLAATDFALTDNGVPQQIDQVLGDVAPVDVTLILDASGSTDPIFKDIRRDGQRTLGLLKPQDRVRIMVIETVSYELLPLQTVVSTLALPQERLPGTWSSIHDAMLAGLVTKPDPGRRRLMVVITDGNDTRSITSVQALERVVRRTDTVLHVVPHQGRRTRPERDRPARRDTESFGVDESLSPASEVQLFRSLPALSGGAFHTPDLEFPKDTVDVVREAFELFRQSYVVQYTPRGVANGGWHDIDVHVKGIPRDGVQARAGYFGVVR